MNILGINAYHGDVAAVLLRDGQLVAALEEERFQRIKHVAGFPGLAIGKCLDIGGITGRQVDAIAISRKPRAHLWRKLLFAARHRPQASMVADRVRNWKSVGTISQDLSSALGISESELPPIHNVEHHPAHLASTFLCSPYESAAVCAIDGFGDFVSTSLAAGRGNTIDILQHTYFPHSLGLLYSAVTQWLGFWSYGDEFKVMGLAPYGKPALTSKLGQLIHLKDNGRFQLDLSYFRHHKEDIRMEWAEGAPTVGTLFSPKLEQLLGPARKKDEPLKEMHEDVAASLQAVFEQAEFHVLRHLAKVTKETRLCLAGGCAMNSVANGKIREQTPFRDVFVQPASGDNGTALGAALSVWHDNHPRRFVMRHSYFGTGYDSTAVAEALDFLRREVRDISISTYEDAKEMCGNVAEHIANGLIVGWYQGRMEWGARALGNRSILADPRRADMRERINTKIKFREKFRPFAPAILEERVDEYFVGAEPDPFMIKVFPIREDKRPIIPAVTHVDGSGRIQTVSAATNALFYQLIRAFEAKTGVPVLLNTSFNENEPIVDTPLQAADCFARTKMDVLVLGSTIVTRT